jgi:pyruvate dehydrogenase E2 component (dihydrolipoamide acetyltransferase)
MTEGSVAEWRPRTAPSAAGRVIYLLETEKIQFEVEAETAGQVRQLVLAGTTLPTGSVVAYLFAAGESLPEGVSPDGAPPAASRTGRRRRRSGWRADASSSPIARRLAKEAGLDITMLAGSGPAGGWSRPTWWRHGTAA